MYILIGIVFICVTIITTQLIKRSCKHNWVFVSEDLSKDSFGHYYKVVATKCNKCGKYKIKKYSVN